MGRISVELPDGVTGWVEFRPMTVGDLKFYLKSDEGNPWESVSRLEAAIESYEFSNGKTLDEQVKGAYQVLLRAWNNAEDEDALPPENGRPSVLPSSGKSAERPPVSRSSTRSMKSRAATASRRGQST